MKLKCLPVPVTGFALSAFLLLILPGCGNKKTKTPEAATASVSSAASVRDLDEESGKGKGKGSENADATSEERDGFSQNSTGGSASTINQKSSSEGDGSSSLLPPSMVSISPEGLRAGTDATCNAASEDPGSTFHYEWSINQGAFGFAGKTLKSENFSRGDQIRCRARAGSGSAASQNVESAQVTAGNSVPVGLAGVSLKPLFTTSASVTCESSGTPEDSDGDDVQVFYVLQKRGGESWTDVNEPDTNGGIFSEPDFDAGEEIRCAVFASDGTDQTEAIFSESQTVKAAYRYYRFRMTRINKSVATTYNQANAGLSFYWDGSFQTNAMTSNSTGTIGGVKAVVSAPAMINYSPYRAFDNSNNYWTEPNTYNSTSGEELSPQWLKVDFGATNELEIKGIRLNGNSSYFPSDFHLEGSNNNTDWTDISPRYTDETGSNGREFLW